MNRSLRELLGFLDGIVDGEQQRIIRERYRASLSWEDVDRPPLVLTYPLPLGDRFQPFPHREVFDDMEKMLHNELIRGFEMSHTCQPRVGDDLPITVRANYGIGIIPSLFGARVEQHLDDPPWVLGYEDEKAFLSVMDRDPFLRKRESSGIGLSRSGAQPVTGSRAAADERPRPALCRGKSPQDRAYPDRRG